MKATDIFLETIGGSDFHTRSFSDFPLNYPMHYHSNLELLYCSKGEFRLHVDKYTYTLREGSFAVVSPMAVHCVSCRDSCSCTCLHISESLYLQMDAAQSFRSQQVGYIFPAPSGECGEIFSTLYLYIQKHDRQLAICYTMILLTLLSRRLQNTGVASHTPENRNAPLLQSILSYVQSHYKEALTLEQLSGFCHISKSAMSRILNTDLQTSLPELVNKYRMLEAAQLLKNTRLPITQIACSLGYGSPSGFNRHFQRHFGISPREYRKSILEGAVSLRQSKNSTESA